MSRIDQMAQLVLADPTITAKELAQKMGYAEQKSVYYWLEKAGYRGMKEFKKSVLSGCFRFGTVQETPAVKDSRKLPIPLYAGDKMKRVDCSEYLGSHLGPEAFAIQLSDESPGHPADKGNILIIDPEACCNQGSIVLVSIKGRVHQARVYYLPDKSPIYVDSGDPSSLLSPDFVIGKVVFVIRRAI